MRRAVLAVSLAALALPAAAQDFIILTPAQIGQIFCISRVGNDMAPVMGILTPELTKAISEAETKDDAWEKANPGDKPPLGDGIPWQTGPDYAATCTVGEVTLMMDDATVKLAYGFPDYPAANYADTLHLKLVVDPTVGEKVWRIDNVGYADEGDLKTTLVSVFMN